MTARTRTSRAAPGAVLATALLASACSSASVTPPLSAPTPKNRRHDVGPRGVPGPAHLGRGGRNHLLAHRGGRPISDRTAVSVLSRAPVDVPRRPGRDPASVRRSLRLHPSGGRPESSDRDEREGLPIGLHLTDDPNTHVPFVVHSCALCHSQIVKWPGGEKLVIGLGNRKLRHPRVRRRVRKGGGATRLRSRAHWPDRPRIAEQEDIPWAADWRDSILGRRSAR